MKGNEIVVLSPYGRKIEGTVSGTPKPGTLAQIKTATEPVGGEHTWEIWNPASGGSPSLAGDGIPGARFVFDLDCHQGGTYDTAYVSGTRCQIWCFLPGDHANLRKADISGTSSAVEDLAIGDRLLAVGATGFISKIAVGVAYSPVEYAWQSLETLVDQPAETLVWCMKL